MLALVHFQNWSETVAHHLQERFVRNFVWTIRAQTVTFCTHRIRCMYVQAKLSQHTTWSTAVQSQMTRSCLYEAPNIHHIHSHSTHTVIANTIKNQALRNLWQRKKFLLYYLWGDTEIGNFPLKFMGTSGKLYAFVPSSLSLSIYTLSMQKPDAGWSHAQTIPGHSVSIQAKTPKLLLSSVKL